jgi:hypothetical protein
MTGRDSKAHMKGFVFGLIGIAVVVLVTVYFTNQKFASHAAEGAAPAAQH